MHKTAPAPGYPRNLDAGAETDVSAYFTPGRTTKQQLSPFPCMHVGAPGVAARNTAACAGAASPVSNNAATATVWIRFTTMTPTQWIGP